MSLLLTGKHAFVKPSTNKDAIIKSVKAFIISDKILEEQSGGGDCHSQSHGHWIIDTPIATPMSIYEVYKKSRKYFGIDVLGTMIVEVKLYGIDKQTNDNIVGYGVSIAGEPGCYIVEKHFSRFIEGQSIYNIELIWDQMYKASLNYGRKGITIQALSCCDLALWDAFGKYKCEPVFNLLGGKTKDKLPIYCTTARPDLAQKMGFIGSKFPLPYSPADGEAGMKANIDRIKEICDSIQPNKDGSPYPIMIDCWMSLTVKYTIELINNIKKYIMDEPKYKHVKIKWIEGVNLMYSLFLVLVYIY